MSLPFLMTWQMTCSTFQAILLIWDEIMMENIYSIKHVFSHYSVMVRWVIGCEWKKELFRKKKALHIEAHSKVRKAL